MRVFAAGVVVGEEVAIWLRNAEVVAEGAGGLLSSRACAQGRSR